MRTHSAMHVLGGVIWNEYRVLSTGNNMEPLKGRIDYEFDPLPEGFAEKIEAAHPGHGKAFPIKARHKRGVTAWVEKPGRIVRGESCRLHVPPQRLYPHLGRA